MLRAFRRRYKQKAEGHRRYRAASKRSRDAQNAGHRRATTTGKRRMRARTVDARTKKKNKKKQMQKQDAIGPGLSPMASKSLRTRSATCSLSCSMMWMSISDSSISVQTGFRCVGSTRCVRVACAVWRSEVDDDRPPDRGGHRDRSLASFSVVVAALLFSSDALLLLLLVLVLLHGVDAVDVG